MRILGLSAYHTDAAAALLVDGRPVAAAKEELFTKTPLDASLPLRAARSCMSRAGLLGRDIDRVVFYEKPLRRFERTLVASLRGFPRSGKDFAREVARWLGDRLWLKGRLAEELGVDPRKIVFAEHMLSHAACAYYLSPFQEAGVLIVDDLGEWTTTAIAKGAGGTLELVSEVHLPHSLGLVSSAFTQFLGFDPGKDDEFLFDLSLFGTPRFEEQVAQLVAEGDDGCPRVDTAAFPFGGGADRLWGPKLETLFGPARVPGSPIRMGADDTRDADLAASVQKVLERRTITLARHVREKTGSGNLCFGGVLARNRGVVGALLGARGCDELFVPAAPADAGGALGAALLVHHADEESGDATRNGAPEALFLGEALGTLGDDERASQADGVGGEALLATLVAGDPVGWARGPLEFAERSMGHRSVFQSPIPDDARTRLLGALQRTEPFLAGRLAIVKERVQDFVELPDGISDSLLRFGQVQLPARSSLKEAAPGAVHPDGTVWVQSVDAADDPALHALLLGFGEATGVPALLHDTLRLRGAVTPRSDTESLQTFDRSGLAKILVGDRLYSTPSDGEPRE